MALQRTCAGCGQTDDHPRMHVDFGGGAVQEFHYDCVPHYLREQFPSPAYEATEKGLRGADVASVVEKHAAKIAKES